MKFCKPYKSDGKISTKLLFLLFFSVFAFSFSLMLIFVKKFSFELPIETIDRHFNAKHHELSLSKFIFDCLSEDTLHFTYACVFGFTFFGKYASMLLSVLRGTAFGYSFCCVAIAFGNGICNISSLKCAAFIFSSLAANILLIIFIAKSVHFSALFSESGRKISVLLSENYLRRYLRDFMGFSGFAALIKILYSVFIYST